MRAKITVENIGNAGGDEHRERNPAQPQPAVENALPIHQRHNHRHGGDPRIGQKVRNRERARRQRSGIEGIHAPLEEHPGPGKVNRSPLLNPPHFRQSGGAAIARRRRA